MTFVFPQRSESVSQLCSDPCTDSSPACLEGPQAMREWNREGFGDMGKEGQERDDGKGVKSGGNPAYSTD